MRPIKLELVNFGSFKKENINFSRLDNMFLIKGKTGSGKSTIFDAMSFALYGGYTGSRSKLNIGDMISKTINEKEDSVVVFTFSISNQSGDSVTVYRITRYLAMKYNSKKDIQKTSIIIEKAKGNWTKKTACSQEIDDAEWVAITNLNGKDVGENLTGLKKDEFNQIVILPQGEFANFLKENTTNRETTLKKIFPIECVEQVTENIKEKYKKISGNIELLEKRIKELEKDSVTIESLSNEIQTLSNEIQTLSTEKENFSKNKENLVSQKTKLENEIKKANEIIEIKEKIRKLEDEKSEIEELRIKLEKSKKAQTFLQFITNVNNSEKNLFEIKEKLSQTEIALKIAKENFDNLNSQKNEIDNEKNKNELNKKEKDELNKKLSAISELLKLNDELKESEKSFLDFEKSIEDDKNDLQQKKSELLEIAKFFDIKDEDSVSIELSEIKNDAEKNVEKQKQLLSKVEKLEDEIKIFDELTKEVNEKEVLFNSANENLKKEDESLKDLNEKQKNYEINHQAAFLAKDLKQGCSCPVCGSTNHIKLASDNGKSFENEIAEQEKIVEKLKNDFEKVNTDFLKSKSEQESKKSRIEEIKKELCNDFSQNTDLISSENVKNELNNLIENFENVTKAFKNAEKLSKEINALSKKETENNKKLNELKNAIENAKSKISIQEKNISGDKNESLESINSKISELAQKIENDEQKIALFEQDFQNADSELKTQLKFQEEYQKDLEKAEKTFAENQDVLNEKLKSSNFTLEEVNKNLLQEDIQTLTEKKVQNWDSDMKTQSELLKDKGEVESIEKLTADSNDIENKLLDLDEKIKEKDKNLTEKNVLLSTKQNILEELKEKREELNNIKKESGILAQLSKDLNGDNSKDTKFASWILEIYLAEVIEYANKRFQNLSGGRYSFQNKVTNNRGNHGLDLAIYADGAYRSPSTLSGGETFLASISLALGLTDVVYNHSGGASLDSLFIDEGFGTLDQSSLQKAIKTLQSIQGDRMIGVISHVESMETEIRSHIVAIKDNLTKNSSIKIENI